MKQHKPTKRQQQILTFLYQYRFLDRTQIQTLVGHSDKRRVISWLKELREEHYIEWLYDPHDFVRKTKPAIYYLGINGIRFLKTSETYPADELRKRYYDNDRSETFVEHSTLLADCCLSLLAKSDEHVRYRFATKPDYTDPDHMYHAMNNEDSPQPDLCFTKQTDDTTTTYLLELFDTTLPQYRMRSRINQYVDYVLYGAWEEELHTDTVPTILLVCPTVRELAYAKRRVRTLLADHVDDTDNSVDIRVTTIAKLQQHGPVAAIWEVV